MSIQLVKANRFVLNRRADTDWPDKFNTDQIADLLTWRDGIQNGEWKSEAKLWRTALKALACKHGEIPYTAETESVKVKDLPPTFIADAIEVVADAAEAMKVMRRKDIVVHHFTGHMYVDPEQSIDVTFASITAPDLARWLAEQDQSPGELLKAWFKSQGVGRTAVEVIPPAPAAPPEAVVMPSPAMPAVAESWHLKNPARYHGYTRELHIVLKAARDAGKPCPSARDVLDSWAECKPIDILEVTRVAFKCKNSNGSVKSVSIDSLRTAIDRMTTPDNAR